MSHKDEDYTGMSRGLLQQPFLGASITNFSINGGYNSNSTSLNVSLVADPRFRSYVVTADGVATPDLPEFDPVTGNPTPGWVEAVPRPDAVVEGYHYWDPLAFPNTPLGDCIARIGVISTANPTGGDYFCPPTPGEPVYFRYYDGNGDVIFNFNGIVSKFEQNMDSSSGKTFTVNIEDPRRILEGSQIVLDKYMGTTAPADGSFNLVTDPFNRKYKDGWLGYYNVINVFGYYEGLSPPSIVAGNYGQAEKTESGMPWLKVLDALNLILSSNTWPSGPLPYASNEPYGGPLYYVKKSYNVTSDPVTGADIHHGPVSTLPYNVHRYKVDLSALSSLPIPADFRVSGTSMTIMTLIQQLCEVGGADFMIDLLEDLPTTWIDGNGVTVVTNSPFAGVINVIPIPRNRLVTPGLILNTINDATRMPLPDGTSGSSGVWKDRVVSSNVGYEFADPPVGSIMIGGPRTRIIGVTPLGAAYLRDDYYVPGAVPPDELIEVMPDAEYDGVDMARQATGLLPTDFSTHTSLPGAWPPSLGLEGLAGQDTLNDEWLAWSHALHGKDELKDAAPGQDGFIDMYPCWGFHNQSFVASNASSIVEVEKKGMPVMGSFHDDSPYRDFDNTDGIYSILEYVDNSDLACVPNIYDAGCSAVDAPTGNNRTKRFKLNGNFVESPASATIPIDLDIVGYDGGPNGANGDFRNYYYATVTELRHAIKGKDSWLKYLKEYQPYLACYMEWHAYCPLVQTTKNSSPQAAVGGLFNGPTRVPKDPSENRGKNKDGKQMESNPLDDANTAPEAQVEKPTKGTATKGSIKPPRDIQAQQQAMAFKKISNIASNFYGKQYLVPLPYSSPNDIYGDIDNWIRKIGDGSMQFELRWDLASAGWAGDIEFSGPEIGKRYPHNINFYDESGKLNAFFAFPRKEKLRCSHEIVGLDFGKIGPDDMHITPLIGNTMDPTIETGKVYVKATVDTKTYWILDKTAYSIHNNLLPQQIPVGQGTCADANGVPLPLYTNNELECIPPNTGSTNVWTPSVPGASLRPMALISISAPVHWPVDDWIDLDTPQNGTKQPVLIPLGGYPDSRQIDQANQKAALGGLYGFFFKAGQTDLAKTQSGPAGGTNQMQMDPARYKPWTCGIPQISNRFTWGPWADGAYWGKSQFIDDSSYAPENFGSVDIMNEAAKGKVISLTDPQVFVESGSVTVTGLPDPLYGLGAQMLGLGPTITDISVDIGPGGITTSYSMQTQRKFGQLHEIYENRIKQLQSNSMQNAKEIASTIKQTKQISFRDLANNMKKK